LIILTVSLGIYGASTARTLDKTSQISCEYRYGSDVSPKGAVGTAGIGEHGPWRGRWRRRRRSAGSIYEPPFYIHKELPGVEAAARVQKLEVAVRSAGQMRGRAQLMAIDPWDFGRVAWTREDLNEHHMNAYLNLLTQHHEGVLVSRELVDRYRCAAGRLGHTVL
jgi:putative ABC transport system permease protein